MSMTVHTVQPVPISSIAYGSLADLDVNVFDECMNEIILMVFGGNRSLLNIKILIEVADNLQSTEIHEIIEQKMISQENQETQRLITRHNDDLIEEMERRIHENDIAINRNLQEREELISLQQQIQNTIKQNTKQFEKLRQHQTALKKKLALNTLIEELPYNVRSIGLETTNKIKEYILRHQINSVDEFCQHLRTGKVKRGINGIGTTKEMRLKDFIIPYYNTLVLRRKAALNTLITELPEVPLIGPEKTQKIKIYIANHQINSIDEFCEHLESERIRGIGERTKMSLKYYIYYRFY